MNMIFGKARQRGVVVVQTVLALAAMLGMAALALDLGNAYLNKTRLQNALDAAALAAAKVLDSTHSTAQATTEANAMFGLNANTIGNHALKAAWSANAISLSVEYSNTISKFTPGSTTGPYVRARATGFQLSSWFARIFGIASLQVAGSAVAGPSARLAEVCDVAPVMVCEGNSTGTNTSFGYQYGTVYNLTAPDNDKEVASGNFQLLDFGSGADAVRDALSGKYNNCLGTGEIVDTQPGVASGPLVQGISTRFDVSCPQQMIKDGICAQYEVQPDKVGVEGISYSQYMSRYETDGPFEHRDYGIPGRRILKVPVASCPGTKKLDGTGKATGAVSVKVVGTACFFLQSKPGSNTNLTGEFIGACNAQGVPGSGGSGTGPQLYEIVLHDDPNSPDS